MGHAHPSPLCPVIPGARNMFQQIRCAKSNRVTDMHADENDLAHETTCPRASELQAAKTEYCASQIVCRCMHSCVVKHPGQLCHDVESSPVTCSQSCCRLATWTPHLNATAAKPQGVEAEACPCSITAGPWPPPLLQGPNPMACKQCTVANIGTWQDTSQQWMQSYNRIYSSA